MEGVWLKIEPIDDNFHDDGALIKMEHGIDVESLVIIEQDESKCVPIESSISEQIEATTNADTNKGAKKSREKNPQPKQLKRGATATSDGKEVEKESGDKRLKQLRKKTHICDECGKAFRGSYHLNRHQLQHSGIKPFVCPVENCEAAYTQNATLKLHQMSHAGIRNCYCEECGQGFSSKFQMRIHKRAKHSGQRPFICKECGEGFTRKEGLVKHELEHKGYKPYECEECGMRFYQKKLLQSHMKTHIAGGRPHTCVQCGKGFFHKTSLNAHERSHLTIQRFECEECGLIFTHKCTLKRHRLKQHDLSTPLPKQQKTMKLVTVAEPKIVNQKENILAQSYNNTGPSESHGTVSMGLVTAKPICPPNDLKEAAFAIKLHQSPEETSEMGRCLSESEPSTSEDKCMPKTNGEESTEFEEFVLEPTIELKKSSHEVSLDQIKEATQPDVHEHHQVSKKLRKKQSAASLTKPCDESLELPFPCGKCDRKFALVGALKNHQRSHKRDMNKQEKLPFVCDECGKIFARKHQLSIHKRIHSGLTPYSCTECNRSFTQLGNLKAHQLIHSGERRFACATCGMKFTKKCTLERHMQSHTDDKDFPCDICGKRFKHPSSIKLHKLRHRDERNFGCDICGKTFFERSYLKTHFRTHTDRPFACDLCPSKFVDKWQLERHKRHRHLGEPSLYRKKKMAKMIEAMDNF